jgi:hypothetical protein
LAKKPWVNPMFIHMTDPKMDKNTRAKSPNFKVLRRYRRI